MSNYRPPFQLTDEMLNLVAQISEMLGVWSAQSGRTIITPQLRRNNRIRSIQASLEIEHNTLSVAQVTAVAEGKVVLGLPREILEVRNALEVYDQLECWSPVSEKDLLGAHALLMRGLVDDAGCYREAGVGVYHDVQLLHMAPPASQLNRLMEDLFGWLRQTPVHPLVASCVFHYELEFIHPFADGNGRIGRLWQTLILSAWKSELAYLPVETVIRDQQAAYYTALREADKKADSTVFIIFMLDILFQALDQALLSHESSEKSSEKILTIIKDNPQVSARNIAKQLGLTSRAVEKQIAKLKAKGSLIRIGAAKGGYWKDM